MDVIHDAQSDRLALTFSPTGFVSPSNSIIIDWCHHHHHHPKAFASTVIIPTNTMMELRSQDIHVQVLGEITPAAREVLTEDCLLFVGTLCARFEARRQALLDARVQRATALDGGQVPSFLHKDHPASSDPHWKCAPIPADIQDRRVEITGPVDRKMVINGLNSGASVYMADFEDSTSPTWNNLMEGQLNLRDAVHRTISYTHPTLSLIHI